METETINKPPDRKYGLLTIIFIVLALIIYYTLMTMLAPVKKLGLNQE